MLRATDSAACRRELVAGGLASPYRDTHRRQQRQGPRRSRARTVNSPRRYVTPRPAIFARATRGMLDRESSAQRRSLRCFHESKRDRADDFFATDSRRCLRVGGIDVLYEDLDAARRDRDHEVVVAVERMERRAFECRLVDEEDSAGQVRTLPVQIWVADRELVSWLAGRLLMVQFTDHAGQARWRPVAVGARAEPDDDCPPIDGVERRDQLGIRQSSPLSSIGKSDLATGSG